MISQEALPESLIPLCLDILRRLNNDEKDLIRIVVEVIHDLRDNDADEDDMVNQTSSGLKISSPIFSEGKASIRLLRVTLKGHLFLHELQEGLGNRQLRCPRKSKSVQTPLTSGASHSALGCWSGSTA